MGLQNTGTNLGASIGTALAGSILIAALTSSFLTGIQQNPAVPADVKSQANVELAGGLVLFFYQYLIQAVLFFTIPLYLSVALGLSAIDTGIRILPLSLTLLLAAAGIPGSCPTSRPGGWSASGCWPCWWASLACSPASTLPPEPRS